MDQKIKVSTSCVFSQSVHRPMQRWTIKWTIIVNTLIYKLFFLEKSKDTILNKTNKANI